MSKITNDGLTQSVIELYSYGNSGRQRVQAEKPSSGPGEGCLGVKATHTQGNLAPQFFHMKKKTNFQTICEAN